MFVLNPIENGSTGGELILLCWVFEGTVRIGDTACHAVEFRGIDFGIDPKTEELVTIQQVECEYPTNLPILRIRKHVELDEMSRGWSGAFNFDPDSQDARRIMRFLTQTEDKERQKVPASPEAPREFRRICLFDSVETAENYKSTLLKENS